MGDANVRRPVATRFEHGVDFGLMWGKKGDGGFLRVLNPFF